MTLQLGMIGLGGLGDVQLDAVEVLEEVSIAGGVDIDQEARTRFERDRGAPSFESTDDMLAAVDLDAASIVTPHTLHYEQARACLEADVHVHLEKPMVTRVEHAVDLIELASDRELALQIGYQRHFDPRYRAIRDRIAAGALGNVHMVSGYLAQDWIDPQSGTWRTDPDLSGGGQLFDSGSHLLDGLLWTLDAKPVGVSATMTFAKPDIDVDSSLALELERDSETITASVGVSGDGTAFEEGIVVWGTDGHLTYDREGVRVHRADGDVETVAAESLGYQELTVRKLGAFVDAVRGETAPAVPGEYGLQVTALTRAAYQSAASGERVDPQRLIADARQD